MRSVLLIVWVILLGADRVDLAGGALPFALTPYLVLTPALILVQGWQRLRDGRRLVVTQGAVAYAALLTLFLALIGGSVFVSLDPETSMSRAMLVVVQAIGAFLVAVHVRQDSRGARALARGATLAIASFAVFDVLEVLSFLGSLPAEIPIGPAVVKLQSFGYAGIIPRLSGLVLDPNRGGLLLVLYATLSPRLRGLAVLLLLLTLSRSAALAGLGVLTVRLWEHGLFAQPAPRRAILALLAMMVVGTVAIGRSTESLEATQRALEPFEERFSFSQEGSAAVHGSLLARAAEEGTRSMKRTLMGLGWGASYVVLQDIFPGSRYGNFHSLYATAFVEAGLPAALVIIVLILMPLARRGPWRAMVFGTALFSIFYQATAEPAFWFTLAMAWMSSDDAVDEAALGDRATT